MLLDGEFMVHLKKKCLCTVCGLKRPISLTRWRTGVALINGRLHSSTHLALIRRNIYILLRLFCWWLFSHGSYLPPLSDLASPFSRVSKCSIDVLRGRSLDGPCSSIAKNLYEAIVCNCSLSLNKVMYWECRNYILLSPLRLKLHTGV